MALLNDTVEDVEEPRLSYERILNDLSDITRTDSITCSCLHSKLFAIGTLHGRIHIFDHQGNKVNRHELCFHLRLVESISIDERGEYLASCSSDRLVVYGLCDGKSYFNLMPDKPLNVVAIDPYFHRPDGGRRFVAGDDRVVLYERGLLTRHKSTILQIREQKVRSLSWHTQFIAWATDKSVQIFDVEQRAIITRIKDDSDFDYGRPNDKCQFCWRDKRTLLIGWKNNVKVCLIKERSREMLNDSQLKELPKKYVEIISMFETDFSICGLAPFNDNLITLSLDQPLDKTRRLSRETESSRSSEMTSIQSSNVSLENVSLKGGNNQSVTEIMEQSINQEYHFRPQIHILETFPNTYNELSKDILTPNGWPTIHKKDMSNVPYSLVSIPGEGIYFIVCPKDIITAKPRDYDDHIDWLIEHSMLKEAYLFARDYSSELVRHSVRELQELYIKDLMDKDSPNGLDRLMQLDCDETSKLLVENIDLIPMKDVIERLESYKSKKYLLSYLHRLVLRDPDCCIEYQGLMVHLYAKYKPDSMLNFLKISTNYRLEEALQVCKDANLIKEVVFLLGRMGDLRIALKYITESQGIDEAIEFCKEHQDSDLWQDLIIYSMDKPQFISALLKNIGTHINDPIDLIDRIPNGCEIQGLMPALVKILQDYQLQISLEQSCRDLMAKDCFSLLEKQIACQTQGIGIKEDQVCDHCSQPLLNESMVVFGCHHVFHEECCSNSSSPIGTLDVDSDMTCRVCMAESCPTI